jgi:hypothetical protein
MTKGEWRAWLLARGERNTNGCLIWTGGRRPSGYGYVPVPFDADLLATAGGRVFGLSHGQTGPHRAIWLLDRGPIPDGFDVEHACHSVDDDCPGGRGCLHRACFDVDHLEPLTRSENLLRGRSHGRFRGATHCVHGHPLSGDNLHVGSTGTRQCRACAREKSRRYAERKRAAKHDR